jgi:hypothetical protein
MLSAAAIIDKAKNIAEIERMITETRDGLSVLERERLQCLAALHQITKPACRAVTRISDQAPRVRRSESTPQRVIQYLRTDTERWFTTEQIHEALDSPNILTLRAALCRLTKAGQIERTAAGAYRIVAQPGSLM